MAKLVFGRVGMDTPHRLESFGEVLEIQRRCRERGSALDVCEFFRVWLRSNRNLDHYIVSFYYDIQREDVLVSWENAFRYGGRCVRLTQGGALDPEYIATKFGIPEGCDMLVLSDIINTVFRDD